MILLLRKVWGRSFQVRTFWSLSFSGSSKNMRCRQRTNKKDRGHTHKGAGEDSAKGGDARLLPLGIRCPSGRGLCLHTLSLMSGCYGRSWLTPRESWKTRGYCCKSRCVKFKSGLVGCLIFPFAQRWIVVGLISWVIVLMALHLALYSFACLQSHELEEVKSAHNKRLDRLKSLQSNFRLIKKQMQILEEECYGWAGQN